MRASPCTRIPEDVAGESLGVSRQEQGCRSPGRAPRLEVVS